MPVMAVNNENQHEQTDNRPGRRSDKMEISIAELEAGPAGVDATEPCCGRAFVR
jgi:hypothetical protein